jgi:hypothetical protein
MRKVDHRVQTGRCTEPVYAHLPPCLSCQPGHDPSDACRFKDFRLALSSSTTNQFVKDAGPSDYRAEYDDWEPPRTAEHTDTIKVCCSLWWFGSWPSLRLCPVSCRFISPSAPTRGAGSRQPRRHSHTKAHKEPRELW